MNEMNDEAIVVKKVKNSKGGFGLWCIWNEERFKQLTKKRKNTSLLVRKRKIAQKNSLKSSSYLYSTNSILY